MMISSHTMSTHGCSPALLLPSTTTAGPSSTAAAAVVAGGVAVPTTSIMDNGVSTVIVHPIVLLSVLDHHNRRQEGAGRVIGTLLGKREGDRVEITNAFAVPHAERGDEVAIGKDFNRQMLALHIRANPREVVVGWYATALPFTTTTTSSSNGESEKEDTTTITQTESKCIVDTSSLIHEFYAGECEDDPIHLVVDTGLTSNSVPIHAYKSLPVIVKNETLANMFHELHCTIMSSDSERICVDRMIKSTFVDKEEEEDTDTGGDGALATQDEGVALYQSMEKLLSMLHTCSTYVDAVVDGTTPPNDTIGRNLSETLSSVPRIQPDVFDKMFNDNLQDLLMVTYLSNITKTQLLIAEKLNETLGK